MILCILLTLRIVIIGRVRKAKSRFEQQKFLPEGETIASFEMLMLATANTMVYMLDHDMEIDP